MNTQLPIKFTYLIDISKNINIITEFIKKYIYNVFWICIFIIDYTIMKIIEYITNSYLNFNKCEYKENCKYILELIMKKNDYLINFAIVFMIL